MPVNSSPVIPVFARTFGSWQVCVERKPLSTDALATAYDRVAPRWSNLTARLGYTRTYSRLFQQFLGEHPMCVPDRPLRVLDCGVGTGDFSLALFRQWHAAMTVTAIDISPAMLEIARQNYQQARLPAQLVQSSITELPFEKDQFDVVLAAHVLEHLPDPVIALKEMRRVLSPQGAVVTCLTRQSLLGAYIQTKWRTHRLTPERALQWFEAAGFQATCLKESRSSLYRNSSLTTIGFIHQPNHVNNQ